MNQLSNQKNRNRALGASLLITLWAAFAFFVIQSVTFETNDDSSMARMAYGMLGEYEPHLVHINVLVGYCLRFALTLFPNIPWYTVFQCGLVLISFFVILYLILNRLGIKQGLLPVAVFLIFFGTEYFLKLQFSKTAGIASMAGLLLIFDAASSYEKGRAWRYLLGGFLTVAGSMYRFNVFCMMLIPLFGVGLFHISDPIRNRDWKALARLCIPVIVVFAVCFVCRRYDLNSYNTSADWVGYKEFNSLRANLMDYGFPDYDTHWELYDSLGIRKSDLAVYKGWDFADSEKFTTEVIRQLVAAKTKTEISEKQALQAVLAFFFDYRYASAMFLGLFFALLNHKKQSRPLFVYVLLAVAGIQLYLFCNGRYGRNRVDVSLACVLFVLLVLYICDEIKETKLSERWYIGCMIALILCAPFSEFGFAGAKVKNVPYYELLATDKEHLYVRTTSTDIPRIPDADEIYPVGYMSNSIGLGGWSTNSAPFRKTLENYGVTNLFRDLVDNQDLYFVATESNLERRIKYIRRNYARGAEAYIVKITEDQHSIYRVSTTPGPKIDVSGAVSVEGMPNAHYSCERAGEDGSTLQGYFYLDDNNSFASSIYCSLTDETGSETLYYVTQHYSDDFGDLMNGEYASFYVQLPVGSEGNLVKLYLETKDELYCIDMGAVQDIKFLAGQ